MHRQKAVIHPFRMRRVAEERKVRIKIRNKIPFLILLFVVNLSLLLFLRSANFDIKNIYIDGLDKLTQEDIFSAGGIREGMNLWSICPVLLRRQLLTLPRVAEADVDRILPGELHVSIKEKEPVVIVPVHGQFLEVAKDGMIIGLKDEYRGEMPLVSGIYWGKMDIGTKISDRARGKIIEAMLPVLYNLTDLPLAEINVSNPQHIIIYTRQGTEVWLGDGKDLEKQLHVLMQIYPRLPSFTAKDGYLDLRVAETPVFVPL